ALAFDPRDSRTLYAGTYDGVFKSTDGGRRWRAVRKGMGDESVFALAIDPQDAQTLYAGTDAGIFNSVDGGLRWHAARAALSEQSVFTLALSPQNPQTLYAVTEQKRRLRERRCRTQLAPAQPRLDESPCGCARHQP